MDESIASGQAFDAGRGAAVIRGVLRLMLLAAAVAWVPAHAGTWADGKATFDTNCSNCHGRYGDKAPPHAFPLGKSAARIQSMIDGGSPEMNSAFQSYTSTSCELTAQGICHLLAGVPVYLADPELGADVDALAFSDAMVGAAASSKIVTLTSGGPQGVTVRQGAVSPDSAGEFSVAMSACTATVLAVDHTCTATVSFAPHSIHAASQATLTIPHQSAAASGNMTIPVTVGAGLDPLTISPTSLTFTSPVGHASSPQSIAVRNGSPAPVKLVDVTVGSAMGSAATYAVDPSSSSTCAPNATLAGGGSCTLNLTFLPTALGASGATVSFTYLGSRRDVALSGMGVDTNLVATPVDPPLVSLVGHPGGTASVLVTNLGTSPAKLGVPFISFGGDFTVVPGGAAGFPDCRNITLPPNGKCAILLQFQSTYVWTGERGVLSLPHDGGQTSDFIVTGSSVELTTLPAALALVAQPAAAAKGQVTVSNLSQSTTQLAPFDTSGLPAGFSVAASTCPRTPPIFKPQASCVLTIQYAPTSSALVSGVLRIPYGPTSATSTAHAVSITVVGSGQPTAFVSTSPAVLRFGPTPPGQFGVLTTTLSNLGSAALDIASIGIDGAGAADFAIAATTCGASLTAGESCNVQVRFKPAAWRSSPARLAIAHDGPGSPTTVTLTGQAWPNLAPQLLAFGRVFIGGSSPVMRATLTNAGNLDLNIGAIDVIGNADGAFVDDASTCQPQSVVAPGASCVFARHFAPKAVGARDVAVQVRHSASSGTLALSLTGFGALPPASNLQAMPPSADFPAGHVGVASRPLEIDLRNTGTAPLTIAGIAVRGGQAADFATAGSCRPGSVLGVGGNCTVLVTFTPTQAGVRAAQLEIDSDARNGRVDVALRGSADAGGQLGVSADSVAFGTRPIGGPSSEGRIAVRNLGGASLSLTGVTIAGDAFGGSSNCGGALGPGARCDISLRFEPRSDQVDYAGQVAIVGDPSAAPTVIPLSGRGTFAPVASLAWMPGAGDRDFGNVPVNGRSVPVRLQLMNQGPMPTQVQDVVAAGASAGDFAVTSSTCASRSLAPGMTCDIPLVFQPHAGGAKIASIQVRADGTVPAGPVLTGLSPSPTGGVLVVSPGTVDLGDVPRGSTSQPQFVSLRNQGGVDLVVQGLETDGPFTVTQSMCGAVPFTLRANSQCQPGIAFAPVAGGVATGTLVVRGDGASAAVALKGAGTGP